MAKFKYYGDMYLRTRDLFELLGPIDMMRVDPSNSLELVRNKELHYIINSKETIALMKIKEVFANRILAEAYKNNRSLYDEIKAKMKKTGFKFLEDYMQHHMMNDNDQIAIQSPPHMEHYR